MRRDTANQTASIPRNAIHQIFNVGHEPIEIVAVLAATPVDAFLPDGQRLELPWRT